LVDVPCFPLADSSHPIITYLHINFIYFIAIAKCRLLHEETLIPFDAYYITHPNYRSRQ
jgi:hypothetical protein